MHKIISLNQYSFIPGCRATDNSIIVQEAIHSFNKNNSKKGHMMLKIDLEKAFDRLELSFIRFSLASFNFPLKLISFIMSCVTTSSISILVNGKLTTSFKPTRENRQGDPISPYLFIICMESLTRLINQEINHNLWNPIKIGRVSTKLLHLLFVDDLVLFVEADTKIALPL